MVDNVPQPLPAHEVEDGPEVEEPEVEDDGGPDLPDDELLDLLPFLDPVVPAALPSDPSQDVGEG